MVGIAGKFFVVFGKLDGFVTGCRPAGKEMPGDSLRVFFIAAAMSCRTLTASPRTF